MVPSCSLWASKISISPHGSDFYHKLSTHFYSYQYSTPRVELIFNYDFSCTIHITLSYNLDLVIIVFKNPYLFFESQTGTMFISIFFRLVYIIDPYILYWITCQNEQLNYRTKPFSMAWGFLNRWEKRFYHDLGIPKNGSAHNLAFFLDICIGQRYVDEVIKLPITNNSYISTMADNQPLKIRTSPLIDSRNGIFLPCLSLLLRLF